MTKKIPESVIDDVVRVYRPSQSQVTLLHLLWDAEPNAITGKDLANSMKMTPKCLRVHMFNLRQRMTGCRTVEVCGRQGTGYWLEYRQ